MEADDHDHHEDEGEHKRIITVYLSARGCDTGGVTYIWNTSDAFYLRENYRLLGDFIGCLPKHISQNQYLSLPLILSYEETCLGVSRGFLKVVGDCAENDYRELDDKDREEVFGERQRDRERQIVEGERRSALEKAKALAKKAREERVREKLSLEKLSRKRRRESGDGMNGGVGVDGGYGEPQRKLRKIGEGGVFSRVTQVLRKVGQWFGDRFSFFGYTAKAGRSKMLAARPRANGVVMHKPARKRGKSSRKAKENDEENNTNTRAGKIGATITYTPTEARSCERHPTFRETSKIPPPVGINPKRLAERQAVFTDLYDKGFYLSCGAKFGSDFLAYAAEPLLFHGVLSIIVMNKDDRITPHNVVALGRLGDSTKKRTVLAYIAEDSGPTPVIEYVGIQWEETLP
eukprot:Plantae.Rhodophyta-Hildenbrandia_rubra.ctg7498.p1 GENE.Plantae.Rhodophyta-Hildenbrandia_rubra.ctg7498~~Plantae.Rhodophyta-Hildenbrandia_rubra.ctg7498.p1  ORF type:complete len:404 (+),score=83.60 Plantae.Rhodophyta-Hildenbrandia_rubra.ctg7498:66-1277(+)